MPALGELVPERFAEWTGEDAGRLQFVSPDVKAVLDTLYQQTLARLYRHPRLGQVMLAAAYGGDQSDATRAHRPEVCYPAQGFVVGSLERRQVSLVLGAQRRELPVRRLVARMGSRHEPVTYWITVGGKVTTSGMEQKLAQMSYGLRGWVPDGLLMRVSTVDRQTERAWRVQSRFLEALCAAMPPEQRWRVFGLEGDAGHAAKAAKAAA